MGIGKRIKEARLALDMTQEELANILGVTKGAVANYENETSHPKEPIMYKMFTALNVDANYLFQDVVNLPSKNKEISLAEYEHIKKYRALDSEGQEHVNTVLEWETKRFSDMSTLKSQTAGNSSSIASIEEASEKRYYITYYQKLASAGSGEYLFSDIPTQLIAVSDSPIARKADFVIGVNGDSMEPDFSDGDRVYVQKMSEIPTGAIGIFVRGNDCFIKELGNDRLISHNKKYTDIPASEDIRCVGLVLGKV